MQTRVSANSFRHGWKVAELVRNVQLSGGHAEIHTGTASAGMPSRQQTWNISTVISTCWPSASCAAEQRTGAAAGEPDRDAAPE
ncbi:hypothetical protein ACHWWK_27280 [Klebsiella pneumoniae]